uniref:Bacterial surface antigen (D15) domain-containing protein n=1 Tax=Babesia bovis TaxID=5865 RepID=A7AM13_BABBO|eukprot:XP_001611165.1 hypothetical protein [Babesia bovis T2Bo]
MADSQTGAAPSIDAVGADEVAHIDVSKSIGDVRVVLKGLSRIKSSVIYQDLIGLKSASTLEELFRRLDDTHGHLNKLGLFKSVVSNVDRGPTPGDIDVVFQFEEKTPSYSLGVTTNQRAEANIELKGEVPGIFGTCNSASLQLNNAGYGSQQIARHQLAWEASVNDLYPVFNERRRASETVLRHAGRSLKNAFSYLFLLDELRGEGIPTSGQCTQFKFEAGLSGGDRQFFKFDYGMLYARHILDKYIMHLNLSMGYIRPFGNLRNGISLLDRFHFTANGGAGTAFRGFGFHGIGPCDQGSIFNDEKGCWQQMSEHTGGDCYGNIQLALHCPIEYSNYKFPLAFCFLNVGSLTSREERQPRESVYGHLLRSTRVSLGAGMSMSVAPGCWLEAFVAHPILYSPTDTISRLQMGLRFKHSMME